ncbi:MAG: phage portal protein, partial [Ruthenibacterium sp.]
MSIFKSIFHSRDKPSQKLSATDSLNGSRYSFFFGGTSSGKPVNEQTA